MAEELMGTHMTGTQMAQSESGGWSPGMTAGPSTMPAAVYHGERDVRLEQVPVPVLAQPGELLIQVHAVGVCGTDASAWAGGQLPIDQPHPVTGHQGPIVLGHEFSGTVVGTARDVDSDWVGKLVACCGAVFCGTCPACAAGRKSQCARYSVVGLHRNGALAQYVSAPAASCIAVDAANLSADEAALAQPMAIAVHAARRGEPQAGQRAVVLGAGGIGAFLVYVLSQWGVAVTAVDLDERRLLIAEELGAERTVRAGTGDDVAAVLGAHAEAPSLIYEVTGTGTALSNALALAAIGGRIVLVGMQGQPVELILKPVALQEQTIVGTNSLVPETDLPEAIRLLNGRRGRWNVVSPTVLPLDQLVDQALAPIASGESEVIKVLIDPTASVARPLRGAEHGAAANA